MSFGNPRPDLTRKKRDQRHSQYGLGSAQPGLSGTLVNSS